MIHHNRRPNIMFNHWIMSQDSLTEQLEQRTDGVQLHLIRQALEPVDAYDQKHLALPKQTQAFHREILMYAKNSICWYARTIIPDSSYQTHEAFFEQLKNKTLGDIIYHNPFIKRLIQPFVIESEGLEYEWLCKAMPSEPLSLPLEGRLSKFNLTDPSTLNTSPFYLVEIFLPGLLQYV